MATYILASLGAGILFVLLDGLANVNPLALRLHKPYEPIARKRINLPVAIIIDLCYGFILAGLFLILYPALPTSEIAGKVVSFAILTWILRVVMSVLSHWVMFQVPIGTHLYDLSVGLIEMAAIAALCGAILRPVG